MHWKEDKIKEDNIFKKDLLSWDEMGSDVQLKKWDGMGWDGGRYTIEANNG